MACEPVGLDGLDQHARPPRRCYCHESGGRSSPAGKGARRGSRPLTFRDDSRRQRPMFHGRAIRRERDHDRIADRPGLRRRVPGRADLPSGGRARAAPRRPDACRPLAPGAHLAPGGAGRSSRCIWWAAAGDPVRRSRRASAAAAAIGWPAPCSAPSPRRWSPGSSSCRSRGCRRRRSFAWPGVIVGPLVNGAWGLGAALLLAMLPGTSRSRLRAR